MQEYSIPFLVSMYNKPPEYKTFELRKLYLNLTLVFACTTFIIVFIVLFIYQKTSLIELSETFNYFQNYRQLHTTWPHKFTEIKIA